MRGKREGAPDAADVGLTEATGLSHVAGGPVRSGLRLTLQRARQHQLHLLIAQLTWRGPDGIQLGHAVESRDRTIRKNSRAMLAVAAISGDGQWGSA
jgi:hypothetical protein